MTMWERLKLFLGMCVGLTVFLLVFVAILKSPIHDVIKLLLLLTMGLGFDLMFTPFWRNRGSDDEVESEN